MANCWTAGFPAALLLMAIFGHFLEVSGQIICKDDELKVNSSLVLVRKEIYPTCGDLISAPVDSTHETFLKDCQRWMGDSDQPQYNYKMRYHVEKCVDAGDSLLYYASICCDETTVKIRCFECIDFEDISDCMNEGSAVECDADEEVCQTTIRYKGETGVGDGVTSSRSTFCAPRDSCYDARAATVDDCKNWSGAVDPVCTSCCETPFCNYDQTAIRTLKYIGSDPCVGLSEPCRNGGTCVSTGPTYECICPTGFTGTFCQTRIGDPCRPDPCQNFGRCFRKDDDSYECTCPTAWHGTDCQLSYPLCDGTDNPCLNGGQCYDHGENGIRCLCATGFIGDICEIRTPDCFDSRSLYYGNVASLRNMDCTEVVDKYQPRTNNILRVCQNHMKEQFQTSETYKDGKHGPPQKVESAFLAWCREGDVRLAVRSAFCCPTCYSLPCQNNGWCTQKGDGDYVCRCRIGWYGKNCELKTNICMVSGDPHYVNFDGRLFSFQGEPGFVLVEDLSGTFSVVGINEVVGSVSYLKAVTVHVCGHTVEMLRQRIVLVDGVEVDPWSYYDLDCFEIYMDGNLVRLDTDFNLVVAFNGDTMAYIQISRAFSGQVRGMCGNFDGDPTNDFDCKDGTDCEDDTDKFGLSWADDDDASVPDSNLECDGITDLVEEHCNQYFGNDGPFDECILLEEFNMLIFEESCKMDVCADQENPKDAACKYLQSVAALCFGYGHDVSNWRQATGCDLQCDASVVPVYGGYACHASCQNPNAESTCGSPNTDSCKCPPGLVRDGVECVDPSTCGCVASDGTRYQIGDIWMTAACDMMYTCEKCSDCDYNEVGVLQSKYTACPAKHTCKQISETRGECVADELDCPTGTTYRKHAPCPNTCAHLSDPESCTDLASDEQEACVCPHGKLLQDDVCVDASQCPCVDGDDTRQPGEQWDHRYRCTITRQCKDGRVEKEGNKQCHKKDICVTGCDRIVIKLENIVLESTTEPIPVIAGQDYTLSATLQDPADSIVLIRTVGGAPDSIQCDSTDECSRIVSFIPAEGAMAEAFVGAAILDGNTRTQIMVPVTIMGPSANDQCPTV